MYDQVIPAVRDTLRKIPELSESEGTNAHRHTHTVFCEVKCLKNSTNLNISTAQAVGKLLLRSEETNYLLSKGFHFSQTQLESFFFL